MKRVVAVISICLMLTSCAPVQDRSYEANAIRSQIVAGNVPEEERELPGAAPPEREPGGFDFNRERLTIEPVGMSASLWSGGLYAGSATGMTWRKWLAYRGFTKISEPEFFRTTGYEQEAKLAETFRTLTIAEAVGGVALAGLGLLLLSSGYDDRPVDWGQVRVGYAASIVGIALTWDGSIRMEQNWAPYDLAKDIASQYNARLLSSDSDDVGGP